MIRVTTFNLSPDASVADVFPESRELGSLAPSEFQELLRRFSSIDPVQNQEHDPRIHASGTGGRLVIRTSGGLLFAYDPGDPASPAMECTPAGLSDRLRGIPPAPPASVPGRPGADPGAKNAAPRRGIALGLLAAGLALNAYAVRSALRIDRVAKAPAVTPLTDPQEIAARRRSIVGTYATGRQPGSRVIVLSADSTVRFHETGARGAIDELKDTYRVGTHDGQPCLATLSCGVIDITGPETVTYFKDVYVRTGPR